MEIIPKSKLIESKQNPKQNETWGVIQYKDVVLPV